MTTVVAWLFAGISFITAFRVIKTLRQYNAAHSQEIALKWSQPVSGKLFAYIFVAACIGQMLIGQGLSSTTLIINGVVVAIMYGLLWLVHESGIVPAAIEVPPDASDSHAKPEGECDAAVTGPVDDARRRPRRRPRRDVQRPHIRPALRLARLRPGHGFRSVGRDKA